MQKQLLRAQRDLWNGTAGSWAQGYRAGNLVFLQGQTGLTLDGEVVAPGDPAGQTRLALENIRTLMELAGGSLSDVVKIVVYAHRARLPKAGLPDHRRVLRIGEAVQHGTRRQGPGAG